MRNAQEMATLIKTELKSRNITSKEMLLSLGLNRNVMFYMQNGSMPSADKLAKIALYLNVSMEYLMGLADD